MTTDVSDHCARGLHMYCRANHTTCGCLECHFVCARCRNVCRTLNGPDRDLCATCARQDARASGAAKRASQACDHCGAGGAIRDPRTRENLYLCSDCRGEPLPRLPGVSQDLNAPCAGQDTSDERHEWVHIRGRKHVCIACTMRKFEDPRREPVDKL